MTRDEAKRLRRTWRRGGLPGFGTTPPVPSLPVQRPAPGSDEASERIWRPESAQDSELAAIYPDAGEGWDARSLPREGSRF